MQLLAFAVPPAGLGGVGGRPHRTLVGFERVAAVRGEVMEVEMALDEKSLLLAGAAGAWTAEIGKWTVQVEAGAAGAEVFVTVV